MKGWFGDGIGVGVSGRFKCEKSGAPEDGGTAFDAGINEGRKNSTEEEHTEEPFCVDTPMGEHRGHFYMP